MLYFKIGFENGDSFETDSMGRWTRRGATTWGVCSTWVQWMTICSAVTVWNSFPPWKWRWPRGFRPVAWWC